MVKEAGESCAVAILAGTCLFSIITAISLPSFYNADVSRINFNEAMQNVTGGIDQVRFGNWNYCLHRNSLDADPCNFFTPCELLGTFRICSPLHFGYDLRIHNVTGLKDIHISSTRTNAFVVHILSAGFALLNLLFVLLRKPNGFPAALSFLFSFIAAVVSVAFRHFAGNQDAPGMGLAIVACIFRFFEYPWTLAFKDYVDVVQAGKRTWISLSDGPLGPIVGERDKPQKTIRARKLTVDSHLQECPLCWEPKNTLLALPCTHTFCERCIKDTLDGQQDKRCPFCGVDATVDHLRQVFVTC